jgi:hypothetical protein
MEVPKAVCISFWQRYVNIDITIAPVLVVPVIDTINYTQSKATRNAVTIFGQIFVQ